MTEKIAKILNALTAISNEHARAIDLLGKVHGLEWNRATQEWEQAKKEVVNG